MFTTGNGDLVTPSPALFLRCRFIANKATMAGGAMTTASGQETIVSSVFESNSAGAMKGCSRQVCCIAPVLAGWVHACYHKGNCSRFPRLLGRGGVYLDAIEDRVVRMNCLVQA